MRFARTYNVQPASTQRGHVGDNLSTLLGARLHNLGLGIPYQRADRGDEAEARLKAVS